MSKRVVAFVDGFNLYHSISMPRFRKYRWLDLKKLVTHFLRSDESLDTLHYYTAFATWRSQDSMSWHRAYISALESTGVNVTLGKFLQKTRSCPLCGGSFSAHEEKFTDVNIAVGILSACIQGKADVITLISGDNDLVPALEAAKLLYPQIDFTVLFPLGARVKSLTTLCTQNGFRYAKISEKHLANAQLPEVISLPKITLQRPAHWN